MKVTPQSRPVAFLSIVLWGVVSVQALAAQAFYRVVSIADGDTITVLDANKKQTKVRLAGIDAPEKKQDYGDRAKKNLSDLIFGKDVTLVGDKTDRYGRLVAKVLINGTDANLEQVRAGLAWHFKRYQSEQSAADRKLYAAAEVGARVAKTNIWSLREPIAPWDFRKNRESLPY